MTMNNEGTKQGVELKSVVVSSQAKFNLLSLTALMNVGWQLQGDAKKLILAKDGKPLIFIIQSEHIGVCCLLSESKELYLRN